MKHKLQKLILATLIMTEALLTIDVCQEYLRLQALQQAHQQTHHDNHLNMETG